MNIMIFHLFQRAALLNFPLQRCKFIVAGLQLQSLCYSSQSAVDVAKMTAQLGHRQPNPRIDGFFLSALFGIFQRQLQLTAIHQRRRITIIPGTAASRIFFSASHALYRCIIRFIGVQIVAGIAVPQSQLQISVGLLPGKPSAFHTGLYKFIQICFHLAKVAGIFPFKGFQRRNILSAEQGTLFLCHNAFFLSTILYSTSSSR